MNTFYIHYRNTQGTLMRILTAVSRRGLDIPHVKAEPIEKGHRVTLMLDVSPKQAGQLNRDWRAIVDVVDVRAGVPARLPVRAEFVRPPASFREAYQRTATPRHRTGPW